MPTRTTPPLAQAASLMRGVLAHAKVPTIDLLLQEIDRTPTVLDSLLITAEQQALMDRYADPLRLIDNASNQTIMVCDTCGLWLPVKGTSSARCMVSFGCKGKMVTATKAKFGQVEEDR